MRNDSSKNKRISSNKGNTMVETLVAFTVLMIVLGLLYTVIAFCTTLRMRSADTGRIMTAFSREIYAKNPEASLVDVKHYDTVKDGSGKRIPLFYMQLDTEKTSKDNFGPTATDSQLAGYAAKRIGFYNFTATSYEYKPSDAEKEEKLIIPSVLDVEYKTP